jgi:N-acetylneuraminic acid mutarotase
LHVFDPALKEGSDRHAKRLRGEQAPMSDMRRREFITLLGGGLLAGDALLATAAFAQGTGRWTVGTPMPSARTEVAVAEVDGKIYVIGGFGGERELEVYDPASDRWSRGALIPRALQHAAAVGWQDKLYVIGGFVEGWTPTDDVHEYDPASDRWRRLAALPTPRGALAAAVLGGKIHAVGASAVHRLVAGS